MMLTLGSLFDGIGGWQVAAVHAGVEPIWSSEIEPFPCAVTAKHFPNTVQLGDITKLDGAKLWPVDIICAGSPCQDLSVAGKPGGGKGALISKDKSLSLKSDNDQVLFEKTNKTVGIDTYNAVVTGDVVSSLTTAGNSPTSTQPKVFIPDKARSLTARNDGSPCVDRGPDVVAVGYDAYQHHNWRESKTLGPLTTAGNFVRGDTPLIATENTVDRHAVASFSASSYGSFREDEKSGTIKESDGDIGGGSETIICGKSVRRLTPIECERLQGLPDNYTLIDDKSCSDTARYKALGNGMAQPNADYVIKRIVEVAGNDS